MIQSLPRCDDYGADDNDDAGDNKEEGMKKIYFARTSSSFPFGFFSRIFSRVSRLV